MKQKTIKLSEPVEFAGQQYTTLTLKKLKVKHMLEMDMTELKNPIAQFAALAAASAGVDVGVIHELDMDDFTRVQEALENFTGRDASDSAPGTPG